METHFSGKSIKTDPTDDLNYVEPLLSPQISSAPSKDMGASTSLHLNQPKVKRVAPTRVDEFEVPNSVEMLVDLFQQRFVDVNTKDRDGKTLLLKSINMYRSDSLIMHLLNENSDPNVSDKHKETPLHAAVMRPTPFIAHELIKRGADLNATTKHSCSPLHQAVDYSNLEAVCLLLYHGADANVLSKNNTTPFMNALSYGEIETSEILINYHDEDCLNNAPLCSALYYATQRWSPLAVQLVEMGANVNFVTRQGENLLVFSLFYNDATLFKLMWARYDYNIILNSTRPFLLSFLTNCCFPTCDWVDCLSLILNSRVASGLVHHYHDFIQREPKHGRFFQELLKTFHRKNVKPSDRLACIYLALSLGVEANIRDITTAYELYGFNAELEILIYFLDYDNIASNYSEMKFLLLPFILALEDDFDLGTAQVVTRLHNCAESLVDPAHDWLGFFTRPHYESLFKKFANWWLPQQPELRERLQCVPEFPSLFELSRNQARKFIKRACRITRPYHFHDAVKSLNLPEYIKDVIRFKVPVYT